jgi:hypothetical protein
MPAGRLTTLSGYGGVVSKRESIPEYQGQWYIVGTPAMAGFKRSPAMEHLNYNPDGSPAMDLRRRAYQQWQRASA